MQRLLSDFQLQSEDGGYELLFEISSLTKDLIKLVQERNLIEENISKELLFNTIDNLKEYIKALETDVEPSTKNLMQLRTQLKSFLHSYQALEKTSISELPTEEQKLLNDEGRIQLLINNLENEIILLQTTKQSDISELLLNELHRLEEKMKIIRSPERPLLIIKSDDVYFAIPLEYVQESVFISSDIIDDKSINYYDSSLMWRSLKDIIFAVSEDPFNKDEIPMVILATEEHKAALFVDDIIGPQKGHKKSLATYMKTTPYVTEALLLPNGVAAMVLDIPTLLMAILSST